MAEAVTQGSRIVSASPVASGGVMHLRYLDGIRGLAALYVLLDHVQLSGLDLLGARNLPPGAGSAVQHLARFVNLAVLGFGHVAVDVFIVLSGYCLMIPVATSADGQLRGGLRGFVKRRARRILPPYYVALALTLLIGVAAGFERPSLPLLLSHAALVHNATPQWLFGINGAMWSIAVEWQIYFVFALLLLPAWRRFGGGATLGLSFLIGLAPLYLLPREHNFDWSCPWYVGLFAMGMLAANIGLSSDRRARRWNGRPWAAAAIITAFFIPMVFAVQRSGWAHEHWVRWFRQENRGVGWPLDVLVGVAVSCTLLSLTRVATGRDVASRGSWLLGALQSRPLGRLGDFSYSLYLIHAPVVSAIAMLIGAYHLTPLRAYCTTFAFGTSLGLAAGYLFYLAVERHCLGSKRASQAHPAALAAVTAAPLSVHSHPLAPAAPFATAAAELFSQPGGA